MTQQEFDTKLTPEQQKAMRDLQARSVYTWEQMLEMSLPPSAFFEYVGVRNFQGMYVGIEPDGNTHT